MNMRYFELLPLLEAAGFTEHAARPRTAFLAPTVRFATRTQRHAFQRHYLFTLFAQCAFITALSMLEIAMNATPHCLLSLYRQLSPDVGYFKFSARLPASRGAFSRVAASGHNARAHHCSLQRTTPASAIRTTRLEQNRQGPGRH
jgi:hypothetical protein